MSINNVINTLDAVSPGEELDKLLIPNEIYDQTINREKDYLIKYFLDHPILMFSFVGFNSQLKQANQLASNRKCGCFYKMPWITKFAADKGIKKTILLFGQQVSEYRYMIRYWYPNQPSLPQSYMRYLSMISLQIILDLKRYNYDLQNNLAFNICCKNNIYLDYFQNGRALLKYIQTYLNSLHCQNNICSLGI